MSTPNNTDLLLVERGGSQYKIPYSDLNNKLDTDVFLVERDGVQYKILGEFIGGSEVGTVSAAPVLSADNDSIAPAVITVANATVGNATLTSNVWFKDGIVIAGVTGSTYSATDAGVYSIKQTWTDGLGNTFQVEAQLELAPPSAYVDDLFSTFLYDGTSNTKAIANGIDLAGEGGLVWIKSRGPYSNDHFLADTERGATKYLVSNERSAEVTNSSTLTSFNSNGFTLGSNSVVNGSGKEIVSWTFRKAPGFFDIQTYTGTGAAHDIAHNLGSVPGMILIKETSSERQWFVYHRGMGAYNNMNLDSVYGQQGGSTLWNNTNPTATHFTVGTSAGVNNNGGQYVAYIFAHDDQSFGTDRDESIIKCGTYTGDGSDANFVNVGFEPQWLMIRNINNNGANWLIVDPMRGMPVHGGITKVLSANDAAAETTQANIAPNSTGFTLAGAGSYSNLSGNTFIYMAIRRPHKPPTAGTEVLSFATASSYQAPIDIPCNFAPDFFLAKSRTTSSGGIYAEARLTDKWMHTNAAFAEDDANYFHWDGPGGNTHLPDVSFNQYPIYWQFRRAPGFFDVVTYTGNISARTISHNLGVAPELMLVKARDRSESWVVYSSNVGATSALWLDRTDVDHSATYWNNTAPTAQEFSIGTSNPINANGAKFIAYLFSTLPGVSKVGSYTGTGYQIDVDCGFTTAARFLMIKRTDSSGGDWYVWDTARGLFGPPEPYLLLNSENKEVTGYDYVDPYSTGFTVTSTAPAEINAAGGEYLFLAIA